MKLGMLTGVALLLAMPAGAQVTAGYTPQDTDERGLWMQMEEAERKLKASNFVVRDHDLNTYVRQVFCRTVGSMQCQDVRIYIIRTPFFNAQMSPNGMMLVFTGLLLRTRDEAQLAAILGHEFTHYRNQHSLKQFRDVKSKTNALAWLAVVPVAGTMAAVGVTAIEVGVLGSIYSYSREMEAEADAGSVPLMAQAGYDPTAAPRIWEQLRAEADATAAARNQKSRRDKDRGMFATHPPSAERVTALTALAAQQVSAGPLVLNRAEYRRALAPFWTALIDDQIKLNNFGATDFLLQSLAGDGWTSELYYARGELYRARGKPEDLKHAADFYQQAVAQPDVPAEAWRGLGLALLRSGGLADGRAALLKYLERKPDAGDKAMISMLAGEH